jgi:hypothetical protein
MVIYGLSYEKAIEKATDICKLLVGEFQLSILNITMITSLHKMIKNCPNKFHEVSLSDINKVCNYHASSTNSKIIIPLCTRWTPYNHKFIEPRFKKIVMTLLMCRKRSCLGLIPFDVLIDNIIPLVLVTPIGENNRITLYKKIVGKHEIIQVMVYAVDVLNHLENTLHTINFIKDLFIK